MSLAVLAGGLVAVWLAWRLPMGTWDRMGPGFLPVLAASGLVLAALAGLREERAAVPTSAGSVNRLAIASSGVAGFALLVEPAGGLFAAFVLSLSAAFAAGLRPMPALVCGSVLGAGTLLLFVYVLGVPIPLRPSMIAR